MKPSLSQVLRCAPFQSQGLPAFRRASCLPATSAAYFSAAPSARSRSKAESLRHALCAAFFPPGASSRSFVQTSQNRSKSASPVSPRLRGLGGDSVSDSVSDSGGVSETADETFLAARCARTRSVLTSDLYWRFSHPCGTYPSPLTTIKPASKRSFNPRSTWSKRALSRRLRVVKGGMNPSFSRATHRHMTQKRNCRSVSAATFGSSTTSV